MMLPICQWKFFVFKIHALFDRLYLETEGIEINSVKIYTYMSMGYYFCAITFGLGCRYPSFSISISPPWKQKFNISVADFYFGAHFITHWTRISLSTDV